MSAAHGVVYPQNLLQNVPQPSPSVHLLSSNAFEQLHLSHILAHPQDHVLFPFLHGLEGENEAQNSFFATAPNAHETHMYTHTQHPRVKIPKYRGLVCVVCEEDLQADGDLVSLRILRRRNIHATASAASSPSSSMYSSSSESYEDDDDYDFDMDEACLDVHVGIAGSDDASMHLNSNSPIFHEQVKDKGPCPDPNAQTHMHPVSHRSITPPARINVPSFVSSSNTSSSSGASFSLDNSTLSAFPESDLTSLSSNSPTSTDVASEGCVLG